MYGILRNAGTDDRRREYRAHSSQVSGDGPSSYGLSTGMYRRYSLLAPLRRRGRWFSYLLNFSNPHQSRLSKERVTHWRVRPERHDPPHAVTRSPTRLVSAASPRSRCHLASIFAASFSSKSSRLSSSGAVLSGGTTCPASSGGGGPPLPNMASSGGPRQSRHRCTLVSGAALASSAILSFLEVASGMGAEPVTAAGGGGGGGGAHSRANGSGVAGCDQRA